MAILIGGEALFQMSFCIFFLLVFCGSWSFTYIRQAHGSQGFHGVKYCFSVHQKISLGSSISNSGCNVGVSVSKCLCNFFLNVSLVLTCMPLLQGYYISSIKYASIEVYYVFLSFVPSNILFYCFIRGVAIMLLNRCNESLLNEFGMARPSKTMCEELLQQHLVIAKRIWDGPTL